jgi:hypothetical protein
MTTSVHERKYRECRQHHTLQFLYFELSPIARSEMNFVADKGARKGRQCSLEGCFIVSEISRVLIFCTPLERKILETKCTYIIVRASHRSSLES